MKTVARVMWIHEADLIKAKLQLHDIDAFIPDEGISSTLPIYGNTIGGIRIQVADDQYETSMEILEQERLVEPADECCIPCPSCGSNKVTNKRMSSRMFFGSMLLLGFPFLWMKNRFVCKDCGNKWKEK